MADQKTGDAALSGLIVTYYEKVGLERLLPKLRFYQFGDKKPLPSNSGKTINRRLCRRKIRFKNLGKPKARAMVTRGKR